MFAEALAAVGVPALRFDYAGTGDSIDLVNETNQIESWTADIAAAASAMRNLTGVRRVCLLGFRLGALLAARAASESIDALILIAPIMNGRRYVRELRITEMAASLRTEDAVSSDASSGTVEVAGFSLSAASIATLGGIDLERVDMPPTPEILVIDRTDLPTARTWSEQASRRGAQVQYQCLPGTVEMFLTAPQFGSVSEEMIVATKDWISLLQVASPPIETTPTPEATPAPVLSLAGNEASPDIVERPVFFGGDTALFGIVSEPQLNERARRGVILLNAAVDPHFGAGRRYVSLARRWARNGYVVLRMDLAGIGDSATRADCRNDEVFPPQAMADVRAAADFLSTRYGVQEIVLGGLCSGGYHALRAAVDGLAVRQIFLINPENYFWKQGTTLKDVQLAEAVRNPAIYRERVQSAAAWRRLLSGRVNVWRILDIYAHRGLLALESALRDIARSLHIRLPSDLGSELEELRARGVQVVFVFARGEPGIELLKLLAGSVTSRLSGSCRVHLIDGGDHTFSRRGPWEICESILTDELTKLAHAPQPTSTSRDAGTRLRTLREKRP
jgi:alpha-beta hydrolase superfamily lysophospholipase